MKQFIFTTSLLLLSIFLFGQSTDRIVTEKKELEAFTKISNYGGANIYVQYGEKQKVEIKGEEGQLDRIELSVEKDKLSIKSKKSDCKSYKSNITVYITLPEIQAVKSYSSGNITIEGFEAGNKLIMAINGSSDVRIDNSTFNDANIAINGSGDVKALDTKFKSAAVSINGSGNVSVNCSEKLSVMIAGSGNVSYLGQAHVEKSIMGSGNVKHL